MNNIDIGQRIRRRRLDLGMTQGDVAGDVGVAVSTVQRYEAGAIDKLKLPVIQAIARALRVNPDWLMGTTEDLTPTASSLPANIIPMPRMRKIPLLGSIACGQPILAAENFDGEVDIPANIHADFALRCQGDSMINARIFDGDTVYIQQCETVENGEIAAVLIDGDEATLKRVRIFDDHVSLEPENPQYRPFVYWGDEMNAIRILGRAVAFTSTIR